MRAHVPIFVHESVLEEAGMTPDSDLQTEGADDSRSAAGSDDGGDRLSIFEDFIDQLDLDKLDDKDKPDEPSDDKKT